MSNSEALRLVIGNAIPGDEAIYFRVSSQAADELQALMEEEGVFESRGLEHAAGPELAILIAAFGTAGGLHGLAAVLNAWFRRNEHKSVTLTRGDETHDMKGLSKRERAELINRLLGDAHEEQLRRNQEWKGITGRDSEPTD